MLIEKIGDWVVSRRKSFLKIAGCGLILILAGFLLMLSPLATYTWQPLGILSMILTIGGVCLTLPTFLIALGGYFAEEDVKKESGAK